MTTLEPTGTYDLRTGRRLSDDPPHVHYAADRDSNRAWPRLTDEQYDRAASARHPQRVEIDGELKLFLYRDERTDEVVALRVDSQDHHFEISKTRMGNYRSDGGGPGMELKVLLARVDTGRTSRRARPTDGVVVERRRYEVLLAAEQELDALRAELRRLGGAE